MWLFVAFLLVPLIEIALFIQVGGAIGLGWTLAIVVITAIIGTMMVRAQGALAMNQLRTAFGQMQDPSEALANGAMILFSGALLLTPGFFTDAVGFALLIPAVRLAVFKWAKARVHVTSFNAQGFDQRTRPRDPNVIDWQYSEVSEDETQTNGPSGWTKH